MFCMGYAPNQKGYKCFNPTTKKLYDNMDVTILEEQSFFHENHPEEIKVEEDNFLHESLPQPILHSKSPIVELNVQGIESNKGSIIRYL